MPVKATRETKNNPSLPVNPPVTYPALGVFYSLTRAKRTSLVEKG